MQRVGVLGCFAEGNVTFLQSWLASKKADVERLMKLPNGRKSQIDKFLIRKFMTLQKSLSEYDGKASLTEKRSFLETDRLGLWAFSVSAFVEGTYAIAL